MSTAVAPAPTGGKVWAKDVTTENRIVDRSLRKWIAAGRFPQPDGNLNGRNFWLTETYQQWKTEVLAGKYRVDRIPSGLRPGPRRAA